MPRKHFFTVEQIINHLREAEVLLSQGRSVSPPPLNWCQPDISDFGGGPTGARSIHGLKVNQARRLKELEQEDARLRRVLSDLIGVDKLIFAGEGNW